MSSHTRTAPRLPAWLVLNQNFVLLWLAYGVAAIGDHLSEMALLSERGGLARGDATRIQALISFGFFLPFVIFGPLAGWWSDRFSRKTTMIVADVLRALLVFNLAYIVCQLERWFEPDRFPGATWLLPIGSALPEAVSPPTTGMGDMAIVIPLAIVGFLAAFFSPARQAMLPTLIRDDQLVRANALISALGTVGGITGGVLGGVLVDYLGTKGLHYNYWLNAGTFALSAAFVSMIAMSKTRAVLHPKLEGVFAPIAQGFRYVRDHRRVWQMILLGTVFWGCAGVVISVVPAIVRDVFGGGVTQVSIYRGLLIVGLAVGAAVMSILGNTLPVQLAVLFSLAGAGFWMVLLAIASTFKIGGGILVGLCLFGTGGAGAALLVSITATIQHLVPDARRGRVFGVSDMFTMGAMVAASGILGLAPIPNLDRYVPVLIAIVAITLISACVMAWFAYTRATHLRAETWFIWKFISFASAFWWRTKRDGRCTVPGSGPVILAANHTAGIDPLVQIASSNGLRFPAYIVAEEYYKPAKRFMDQIGCIPIDRKNPGKAFYVAALKHLKAGGCLGIFPQGTFERPGEETPEGKSGVGLIALRTGALIIPCHISGTRYFDNPFAALFFRHKVRIKYGPPIDTSPFVGRERDKAAAEELAQLIMDKIQELAPKT